LGSILVTQSRLYWLRNSRYIGYIGYAILVILVYIGYAILV